MDLEDDGNRAGAYSTLMWMRRGLKKFSFHSATTARICSRRSGVSSSAKGRDLISLPHTGFALEASIVVGKR